MIHAYDEIYLPYAMKNLGELFQMAVMDNEMDIDEFAEKFVSSEMAGSYETACPQYMMGKSAYEQLEIILQEEPYGRWRPYAASSAYWVGLVLAYAQWYLNRTFKYITDRLPCSKLILYYSHYHNMPISRSLALIKEKILYQHPLKEHREKSGFTQEELAKCSGVPVSSIRAYEQGEVDISTAQADTIYRLAKVLYCSIEDLIC